MTTNYLLTAAADVLAEIDAELAVAGKATDGPWTECDLLSDAYMRKVNATFIARARTVCPAALRGMRRGIEAIVNEISTYGNLAVLSDDLRAIIADWRTNRP